MHVTVLGVYEWICNSVNGNYPNVPSPVMWAAMASPIVAAIGRYVKPRVDEIRKERALMHAKLDHVIKHSPGIPEFTPPAGAPTSSAP